MLSQLRGIFLLFSMGLVFMLCLPATTVASNENRRGDESLNLPGWVSFGGKYGTKRNIADLEMFLPIRQSEDDMLYGFIRGMRDTTDNEEGNIAIGYRHIVENGPIGDYVAGGYLFYDRKRSQFNNMFHQATIGGEYLSRYIDGRINFYLPEAGAQDTGLTLEEFRASPGNNTVQLFTDTFRLEEEALPGFDIEIGLRHDTSAISWLDRAEVAAAYYHFERDDIRVNGPRIRFSANIGDPFFDTDAYLTLGLEGQTDDIRGDQAFVEARLTFPFGDLPDRVDNSLHHRLDDRVIRDVDIVTGGTGGNTAGLIPVLETTEQEDLVSPDTGNTVEVIYVANTDQGAGDGTSPANAMSDENARSFTTGSEDVFYVIEDIIDNNGIRLGSGQTWFGGGSDFFVPVTNDGASARLFQAGTPARVGTTATGSLVSAVRMNDNTWLDGMRIETENTGSSGFYFGVYANGKNNIRLTNNEFNISNSGTIGSYTGGVVTFNSDNVIISENTSNIINQGTLPAHFHAYIANTGSGVARIDNNTFDTIQDVDGAQI
jgi:hypothetical protein